MSEGGSLTIVMTSVIAVVSVVAAATALLGLAYSARAQAVIAADAAALAAAPATYPGASSDPPAQAAAEMARANGARMVSCSCGVDGSLERRVVSVTTLVPLEIPIFGRLEVMATARAEFDPLRWLGR